MKQSFPIIGGILMSKLSLLCLIINEENEKKYIKILKKYKANFKTVMYGTGTASNSILEYFGLNEIHKTLILSIVPTTNSKHILKALCDETDIDEPGGGIAFTIPVSSSVKYIEDFYKNKYMEDIEMEYANQELIITITNEGYAENVMNAAKSVGAPGGTTIYGRGLETEKIIKFLGISIEPEKDIVLILAPNDKKNDIMNKIVEKCGLTTIGAGICFSLPVSYVAGLNKVS